METLLTPNGIFAAGTALAGLLLFCLAPYLPSAFPPYIARLVGFFAIFASLAPLWILSGSLLPSAIVGGACLLIMVIVHLLQTRRSKPPVDENEPQPDGVTVIVGDK
ncbi:MAG: hypothetical protein ACYC7E_11605 [Armatimonadota bacterium]